MSICMLKPCCVRIIQDFTLYYRGLVSVFIGVFMGVRLTFQPHRCRVGLSVCQVAALFTLLQREISQQVFMRIVMKYNTDTQQVKIVMLRFMN